MVVETGVEAKKPVEGKVIMKEIINAARNNTDGHCHGVFYWAPELEGQYPLGAFDNHRPQPLWKPSPKPQNNPQVSHKLYSWFFN